MGARQKGEGLNAHWPEIIDTMSEGLLVVGRDGRVQVANQALEKMTGFQTGEMLGQACTIFNCDACELVLSPDTDQWCRLFDPGNENVESRRCRMIRKDGSYLTVLKNASQLKDARGRVIGVVETLTDISELERRERKILELSRRLDGDHGFHGLVGRSPAMRRAFAIMEKAAQSGGPIIIYGESGTGKELAAQAIHDLGRSPDGPFIQLNCAALNESILESELFGHVKGAFTGAYRHRQGRFEAAHGGDIFLDEIGDMPLTTQVKLLRIIESKQLERVGDHRPIPIDVRVIAATHRHLESLVAEKRFRGDLFFRINIIPIHLPPLRERTEDIPLLAEHFLQAMHERHPKDIPGLSGPVMDLFLRHAWPGNVRQLKGALEYAWVLSEGGPVRLDQLPPHLTGSSPAVPSRDEKTSANQAGLKLRPGPEARREALLEALARTGGNQSRAAALLGVSRVTVWKWLKIFGINSEGTAGE